MRKTYMTENHLNETPEWYWQYGLHDAKILQANELELLYDYKLRNPRRNCFELMLDSSQVLYDKKIQCIRLYNYKKINGAIDIAGQWWMCDSITYGNGRYILAITTNDCKNDSTATIQFDDAEVERK